MIQQSMDIIENYAMSFLGVPYKFGGRNRLEGLDCSQLVIEILIAAGVLPLNFDATALKIAQILNKQGTPGVSGRGAVHFYGADWDHIDHCAWAVSEDLIIEAGHGLSTIKTLNDAIARGAYVRIRPVQYRKDYLGVIMPKY